MSAKQKHHVLCQIPTNFRRYVGFHWMAILLTIREALANAVSFADSQVDPEMRIWWIRMPNNSLHMVIAHNGLPFSNEKDIYEKGLKPLQSENINNSFNGIGLTFCASMLREDGELVILSRVHDAWVSYKSYPDRAENQWCAEPSDEWISVLNKRFGKRIDEYNVVYVFRLDENRKHGAPLKERQMNMLPFLCPSFIGKGKNHRWSPKGSVTVYFDTGVLGPEEKFEWSGKGGAARRILPPLAEFIESYQDGAFMLNCEPFEYDLKSDKVRISMSITARTFPTVRGESQWLERIRDAGGGEFKKGSGSSPGSEPSHLVYLSLSCAGKKGQKYARFLDNVVWSNDSIAEFVNACGFTYQKCTKFAVLQFDIIGVEIEISGVYVPMEPLVFAARLEREGDFTLRASADVRCIVELAAANIVDNRDYKAAKARFLELFPPVEDDLVALFLQEYGVTKDRKDIFEILDLNTGVSLTRECKCGDDFCIAIVRKLKTGMTEPVKFSKIDIPPYLKTSFTIREPDRLAAEARNNLAKLELEFGHVLEPLQVEIHFAEYRFDVDEEWKPIENMAIQYTIGSINCRPRRNLLVNIYEDKLKLFTVSDIPARVCNESEKYGGSDASEKTFHDTDERNRSESKPYCEREEHIFGEFRPKESLWRPNRCNPAVHEMFSGHDPRVCQAIQRLYHEFNIRVDYVAKSMIAVKFDSYELLDKADVASEGWHSDDKFDYILNMLWKNFVKVDSYGLDLVEKIRKLRTKYEGGVTNNEPNGI